MRGGWTLVVVVLVVAVVAATRPDDCRSGTFSYSIPGPGGTENTDLAVWRDGREVPVTSDGLAALSSLSPDARRVAFESAQGGRHSDTVGYSKLAIHVADVDGDNREALTAGPHDEDPRWAPDGAKVLFLRDGGLWTVDVETKEEALVYEPPPTEASARPSVVDAAWPGSSSRIAFLLGRDDPDDGAELWVVDSDGSDPHRVATLDEGRADELSWSPKGETFAWTAFEGEVGAVFLMSAAFGAPRMIEPDTRTPIWSRDGERLAYVVAAQGRNRSGVVIGRADGSDAEPVPGLSQRIHDWVSC